ncbi:MAG: class I SAM-dependent methyltransferase [Bacteroidota bacterium]
MMTKQQFDKGIAYAEDNFLNDEAAHLKVDKQLIAQLFDLTGKRVMDFGCGMGGMTLWYARQWDCQVYGYDIDGHHMQIAQELKKTHQANRVTFAQRNILTDPIKEEERFDVIFMNDVAEHIELPILEQVFRQMSIALKPGGRLFVSYPPWRSPYASHVTHAVKIPWCQFLPGGLLHRLIEKNNEELVGELESDLVSAYYGLNHLTHSKLMSVLNDLPLEITYRKSHSFINRYSALEQVNLRVFPLDFLVTKEFLVLQKLS